MGWPPADPSRVEVREARGPGYGAVSAAGAKAARVAAAAEGLLLDPVFTAKAFGELLSMIREGLQGPAVFVHTGGIPDAVLETMNIHDATGRSGQWRAVR